MSEETPRVSTEHHPLGEQGLWHTPNKDHPAKEQLPAYIQNIAHALMRNGMDESQAIATAINALKRWASGHLNPGQGGHGVHPEVQEAAQRALAEWERLKESHQ